jgi:outer membrane protein assembly factor BamE (lipoprotein component of BamABCDE complex)
MKRRMVSILLALVIIGGVVTPSIGVEQGNKEILDSNKTSQLVVGKTTKAEVRALFGEPNNITTRNDGWERWIYSYVKVKMFAASKSQSGGIGLIFDSNGILQRSSISK